MQMSRLPSTFSHTIFAPSAASSTLATPLMQYEAFRSSLRKAFKPRIVPPVARNVTAAMTFVYVVVRQARTSLRCRRMTAS